LQKIIKFGINLAVSQTLSLIGFGPQRTATILLRILQRQHVIGSIGSVGFLDSGQELAGMTIKIDN